MKNKKIVAICILIFIIKYQLLSKDKAVYYIGNIVGQSVLTIVKGLIKGRIHSFDEITKCMLWGGIAGIGYNFAKYSAINGRRTVSSILSNIAFSISDNVAMNRNPFDYLGYSIGFLRVNIKNPIIKSDDAFLRLDISVVEIKDLIWASIEGGRLRYKYGYLYFQKYQPVDGDIGGTFGMFPVIFHYNCFNHEIAHVVQHLQIESIDPAIYDVRVKKKVFDVRINFGMIPMINNYLIAKKEHDSQWTEKEINSIAN